MSGPPYVILAKTNDYRQWVEAAEGRQFHGGKGTALIFSPDFCGLDQFRLAFAVPCGSLRRGRPPPVATGYFDVRPDRLGPTGRTTTGRGRLLDRCSISSKSVVRIIDRLLAAVRAR
jgi:hypothetical protein